MKKIISLFVLLVMIFSFACGCEEEIIEMPTIVIDETKDKNNSSKPNADDDKNDDTDDTSSDTTTEEVDLSDPNVIVGKWEIVTHLVDDKEETYETKYLIITEDYKFYLSNSLTSLSGNYFYTYKDAVITVTLNNQLHEAYAVTMDNEDSLTLKYGASAKVYVDTYKKVQ